MTISCWTCRDRGWLVVDSEHRPCPMCLPADPEDHARRYGGAGALSTIVTEGGPAAVSQAATDLVVAMAKARLDA